MSEDNIVEFSGRDGILDTLTELLLTGARKLIKSAVEAELDEFLAGYSENRTADGHAAVVRNGHHPETQPDQAAA